MANSLVVKTYQQVGFSLEVPFTPDGYFNATKAAKAFGTTPKDWLRTQDAQRYIDAIRRKCLIEENQLVRVVSGAPETGGGTWLHPKLGIVFARWLNVDFALWCDDQIEAILHGQQPQSQPTPQPRLTTEQWEILNRLIHTIGTCCRYQSRATHAAHERLRFSFGLHRSSDLLPDDFDAAKSDLEGLRELAEQHLHRLCTLDEEFITAVIRPPVSIRKVRAMAKKHPQAPLSF